MICTKKSKDGKYDYKKNDNREKKLNIQTFYMFCFTIQVYSDLTAAFQVLAIRSGPRPQFGLKRIPHTWKAGQIRIVGL